MTTVGGRRVGRKADAVLFHGVMYPTHGDMKGIVVDDSKRPTIFELKEIYMLPFVLLLLAVYFVLLYVFGQFGIIGRVRVRISVMPQW